MYKCFYIFILTLQFLQPLKATLRTMPRNHSSPPAFKNLINKKTGVILGIVSLILLGNAAKKYTKEQLKEKLSKIIRKIRRERETKFSSEEQDQIEKAIKTAVEKLLYYKSNWPDAGSQWRDPHRLIYELTHHIARALISVLDPKTKEKYRLEGYQESLEGIFKNLKIETSTSLEPFSDSLLLPRYILEINNTDASKIPGFLIKLIDKLVDITIDQNREEFLLKQKKYIKSQLEGKNLNPN